MRFFEDTTGGILPDGLTPDDIPQGDLTGTEGQFDEPQGGTD